MVIALPFGVFLLAVVGLAIIMLAHPLGNAVSAWMSAASRLAAFALGPVALLTVNLARWISNKVGAAILDATAAVVGWFGALTHVLEHVLGLAVSWPAELLRMQEWLLTQAIPKLIRALVHVTPKVVHAVTSRIVRVERTVVKLPQLARGQAKALVTAAIVGLIGPFLYPLKWLRAHFHALTAVLPHAIPLQWGQTVTQIRRRLRRLERALPGTAAFAAAVAVALARLGIGWVRCNNVRRIGRELCGLNSNTISDLIGLLADVLVLTNVCRVITVLEEGLSFIEPEITAFIGGADAWLCYGDRERPPRLTVPALDLPTASGIHGLPV